MSGQKFLSVERVVDHHSHLRDEPSGSSTSAQIIAWVETQCSQWGYMLTDDTRVYMEQHYESCRREQMLQAAE
jgi:hypothetical protein